MSDLQKRQALAQALRSGFDPYGAAPPNVKPWAQKLGGFMDSAGAYARENPLEASLMAGSALPSPVGDLAGLLADGTHYAKNPEDFTLGNALLSGVGLLPGIPPMAAGLGMVKNAAKGVHRLPMDDASRADRARQMGYSDETFYRGQQEAPDVGRPQFYSRDAGTAAGFGDVSEYRLAMKQPLRFSEEISLKQYVDAMNAAERQTPGSAAKLAEGVPIEGNWTPESLNVLASEHGATPIMAGGLFHQALEGVVGDAVAPLRAAGFDAIDTGRDVRMLKGSGQRLKDATFDPEKASLKDLRASIKGSSFA